MEEHINAQVNALETMNVFLFALAKTIVAIEEPKLRKLAASRQQSMTADWVVQELKAQLHSSSAQIAPSPPIQQELDEILKALDERILLVQAGVPLDTPDGSN